MSLFDSIFGKKSKVKVTMPDYVKGPMKDYAGAVGSFVKSDPYQYVAPASDLQKLAFEQAKGMGSWQAPMNDALAAVKAAGSLAPAQVEGVSQAQLTKTGQAQTAKASGYKAPVLGPAAQAGQVNLGDMASIEGESLLDNLDAYHDPAIENLVDKSMAGFNHEAAKARAAEQARLAGSGAWGSGGQFYMSNFDMENRLKGGQLDAQLRAQAFRDAVAASNMDAGRRQGASEFNAGASNTRTLNQGQLDSQRGLFNTDALNQFALGQAGFDARAGEFNADARNTTSMFNAGEQNKFGMFNAGEANDMSIFNASQGNDMAKFNAGLTNEGLDRALQAAGLQGDIASSMATNSRGDLSLLGDLGQMQHGIDQAYAAAPMTHMLASSGLFGPLTQTFGKTGVESPSLFNAALAMGSLFAGGPPKPA